MRLRGVAVILPLIWTTVLSAQDSTPPGWHRRSDLEAGWVTYGPGTFVASGYGGLLASSPDGVTWTQHESGTTNELVSPIYAGNQFVCVGVRSSIVTSTDGRNWTQRVSPTSSSLMSAAYGNGITVAVGGDSLGGVETQAMVRSTNNGTDWQVVRQQLGTPFYRVAFGANRFVVLSVGASKMLLSQDGLVWQTNDFPFPSAVSLFYAGTNFFALGTAPEPDGTRFPHIWTSPDALTWTDTTIAVANSGLGCAAYGAGTYVATGSIQGQSHWDWIRGTIYWDPDEPLVVTSEDGRTWQQETAPSPILYSLAYGQQTFVAVGRVSTNAGRIYQTDPLVPRFSRKLLVSNGLFRADVVSDPGVGFRVQRSTDFNSWIDVLEVANPPERTPFQDPTSPPPPPGGFYRVLPVNRR